MARMDIDHRDGRLRGWNGGGLVRLASGDKAFGVSATERMPPAIEGCSPEQPDDRNVEAPDRITEDGNG